MKLSLKSQPFSTSKQHLAKTFKKFVQPKIESIARTSVGLATCFTLVSSSNVYAHWAAYPHIPGHPSGCPFCEPDPIKNWGRNENPDDLDGWKVCNRSTQPVIRVAHGSYDGNSWYSKGWWWIKQGTCQNIIRPGLHLRTGPRYLYAEGWNSKGGSYTNRTGTVWGGNTYYFCTNALTHFEYSQSTNCSDNNLEKKAFTLIYIKSKFGHTTMLN